MRYLDMDTAKKVSKIGLGTWQFGSREWGYGDAYARSEAKAIVRRALELGVTLFDTAEIYGFGRSERILGEALGDDLESVFLATKILPVLPIAPVVEQRAVASAVRLGVRKLDLYQVHQPNPAVRDGTIMRGMRALQRGRQKARTRPCPLRRGVWPGRHRLQSPGAGAAVRPVRRVQPASQPGKGQQRAVLAGELADGYGPGGGAAPNRRCPLGNPIADRAGLADPQSGRGGDSRRVHRRAAGKERRRRGHRPVRRGVQAAEGRVRSIQAGYRTRGGAQPDQEPARPGMLASLHRRGRPAVTRRRLERVGDRQERPVLAATT